MEFQSAVAAVHRYGFEQMIESSLPHPGQGIAGALERQPVAHILIDEGEAAKRMGGDGQQQSAAIGQVQEILLRPNHASEQP